MWILWAVIIGLVAGALARLVMPGEDPMTLDTPEQVAEKILAMCLPSCTENGRVYNYPDKRFLDFHAPA